MFRLFKKHSYRIAACTGVLAIYALMMYATDTGLPGCEVGQATPACNAGFITICVLSCHLLKFKYLCYSLQRIIGTLNLLGTLHF
jgi:hypothetical protein